MEKIVSIIPAPQSIVNKNGSLNIEKGFVISSEQDNLSAELTSYLPFLAEQLEACACKCRVNEKAESACPIMVSTLKGTDAKAEAYRLKITTKEILIEATDKAGAFYAIQTLKQLIISNKTLLPCLEIYDYPAFKWRGFLFDTCRFFFTVDFIKKLLDALAFHKMNRFHWHLTDDQGWRFNVPEYPLLAKIGSQREAHTMPLLKDNYNDYTERREYYYTDDMIKEVVAYAEKLNITVVPEVELPGHVSALLASYPEYGCTGGPYKVENRWGIFEDVLCLGNQGIFDIYTAVFKTLKRLFPSQWIHIGGDECLTTRWEKCPKCQALKNKLGLESEKQLQSWITGKMSEIIISLGKTPIGWDEVLDNTEKFPLPKDVIVQSWRKVDGGKKPVSMKHFAIMSPQDKCYLNFKNYDSFEEPGRLSFITLKTAYSFSPLSPDFTEEEKEYVLGGECNLWTEDLPSSKLAEYMLFPRLCAISECLWLDSSKKDFEKLKKSIENHKERLKFMKLLYYDGALE